MIGCAAVSLEMRAALPGGSCSRIHLKVSDPPQAALGLSAAALVPACSCKLTPPPTVCERSGTPVPVLGKAGWFTAAVAGVGSDTPARASGAEAPQAVEVTLAVAVLATPVSGSVTFTRTTQVALPPTS